MKKRLTHKIYFFSSVITICVITLFFTSFIKADSPYPPEDDLSDNSVFLTGEKEIQTLLKSLSDDSFEVREQATTDLWKLGKLAIPALKKATTSDDPELKVRAKKLLFYISAGVLFDSPENVKKLLIQYTKGDIESKIQIIKELARDNQWRQVLHLANSEKDRKVKNRIAPIVNKTALRAAIKAISENDLQLAEEILTLNGNSDNALISRAWFYSQQGQFKQALAKANDMPNKLANRWKLALYRVNGDLEKSIELAKKTNNTPLLNNLAILQGNPMPWLKTDSSNRAGDKILDLSFKIQKERLLGNLQQAAKLADELQKLATNKESASRVISCLAANGYKNKVANLLEEQDATAAFNYYNMMENPAKALAALGISKDSKPPYTEWVKKFTDEEVIKKENTSKYSTLLDLASFLKTKGYEEHTIAVLQPMMKALEKNGADQWWNLIAEMLHRNPYGNNYNLGEEALYFIKQRGNKDNEFDIAMQKISAGNRHMTELWSLLKKRNKKDFTKALHEFGLLTGHLKDPNSETDVIHRELLKEAKALPPEDQPKRYKTLLFACQKRHEMKKALELSDKIPQDDKEWFNDKLELSKALGNWKKVESIYAQLEKTNPKNYINLLNWAISLRKSGQKKKSQEVMNHALFLTMGNSNALTFFASQLAYSGYQEDAQKLFTRSALIAHPLSESFQSAVLAASQVNLTKNQNEQSCKKYAAFCEVYSRVTMLGNRLNLEDSIFLLNIRFKADLCRALSLIKSDQAKAIALLDSCRKTHSDKGRLADEFFPVLQNQGIDQLYNKWFDESFDHLTKISKEYPLAHNTHNSAAWLSACALRRLDEGLKHAEIAVSLAPHQSAYIDTLAEIWFAKGNRAKAIEYSKKALQESFSHAHSYVHHKSRVLGNYQELKKQYTKFQSAPLPNKR